MKTITFEELVDPEKYQLIDQIDHRDLAEKIRGYLSRPSLVNRVYLAANLLALALAAFGWYRANATFIQAFLPLGLGIAAGYLVLVPLHEALHALVYRLYGAKTVTVQYRWRQLAATCMVDRFVTDGRQTAWAALVPFLVINPLLALLAALNTPASLLLCGALVLHVGACSGDFGILNLVWEHRSRGFYMVDDLSRQQTYFYTPCDREK